MHASQSLRQILSSKNPSLHRLVVNIFENFEKWSLFWYGFLRFVYRDMIFSGNFCTTHVGTSFWDSEKKNRIRNALVLLQNRSTTIFPVPETTKNKIWFCVHFGSFVNFGTSFWDSQNDLTCFLTRKSRHAEIRCIQNHVKIEDFSSKFEPIFIHKKATRRR